MKKFKSLLALAAITIASLFAAPAEATIQGYNKTVSVTSTNATTTLTTANPRVVIIQNEGQTDIYADFDRAAVAAATTAWKIAPCGQLILTFDPTGNTFSQVGLITASGASSARIIAQYVAYPAGTEPAPPIERVKFEGAPGCTGTSTVSSTYGGGIATYRDTELITLSTGGATTDSSGLLLHANSIIDGVGCYVQTTITTATDWAVGISGTATRFAAANATMTAGATSVGLNAMKGGVSTDATGPVQVAAAALRITTTGTPGAGKIYCEVYGRTLSPPSSAPAS